MKNIILELEKIRLGLETVPEKCANDCDKEILKKILDEQIPELERLLKDLLKLGNYQELAISG